jgi:hypothetical protein
LASSNLISNPRTNLPQKEFLLELKFLKGIKKGKQSSAKWASIPCFRPTFLPRSLLTFAPTGGTHGSATHRAWAGGSLHWRLAHLAGFAHARAPCAGRWDRMVGHPPVLAPSPRSNRNTQTMPPWLPWMLTRRSREWLFARTLGYIDPYYSPSLPPQLKPPPNHALVCIAGQILRRLELRETAGERIGPPPVVTEVPGLRPRGVA